MLQKSFPGVVGYWETMWWSQSISVFVLFLGNT